MSVYLLDTDAVVWLAADPQRRHRHGQHHLGSREREPEAAGLLTRWQELIVTMMVTEWEHRDPFDRMLVAQSQTHGLDLVTADRTLRSYRQVTCVPWT